MSQNKMWRSIGTGSVQTKYERMVHIMTATNKMTDKILKWMLGIVLALGAISVQGACVCWFHQPEIPDSMKKFAK